MKTIITSLLTFLCTLITCIFTQNKTIAIIEERIKNINNKLNDLTENVKKHNNIIERLYVLETKISNLEHEIFK